MDITCDYPVVSPSCGDQQIPTMQESDRDSVRHTSCTNTSLPTPKVSQPFISTSRAFKRLYVFFISLFLASIPEQVLDPLSSVNRIPNTAYMHTDEGVTASIDNLAHGNPWNTLQNDSPSSDASISTDSAPSYTSATCEVENSVSDKLLHSFDLCEPGAGDHKNLSCSPPVMNSNEVRRIRVVLACRRLLTGSSVGDEFHRSTPCSS